MKTLKLTIFVLCCIFTLGAQAETPQDAAKAILKLVEAKDYDKLFKTRYCELHKAKPEEVKEVIKVLSGYWDKDHSKIVDTFKQLTTAKFEVSDHKYAQVTETGKKATAPVKMNDKERKYVLYEMKTGLWGFHM